MQDNNNRRDQWKLTREKILMWSGLGLIGILVTVWVFTGLFSYGFLGAGLSLCGVSIGMSADKGARK